jgi:hypothetical protein
MFGGPLSWTVENPLASRIAFTAFTALTISGLPQRNASTLAGSNATPEFFSTTPCSSNVCSRPVRL